MGIDPNKSRKKAINAKIHPEEDNMDKVGEIMCRIGKAYEPVALKFIQDQTDLPLLDLGGLRYTKIPCFEGRPDAVTRDQEGFWRPIEVKTRVYPSPRESKPFQSKWDVPFKYWVQLECYLILLDSPEGTLASFSPCNGMMLYNVCRNPQLDNMLLGFITDFVEGRVKERVNSLEKKAMMESLSHHVESFVCLSKYCWMDQNGNWNSN
jgi:hypothetical protein